MKYLSTRGGVKGLNFEDAVMMGLADDGGLLVPESLPTFFERDLKHMSELSYSRLAQEIMSKFIGDIPADDLKQIIEKTYGPSGDKINIPVKHVGEITIAELYHGPTFAFKDIALQFLGSLFEYYLEKNNKTLNIIGATSGDTGSAAIQAMRGKKNINVFILYPDGRISDIQELQMTTVPDENVYCIAVRGSFDNCQSTVKRMFSDLDFKHTYSLGAVNSINWARILAQVVYYFYIYFKAVRNDIGHKVNFAVPTGNFGNIFAGYIARSVGLPIDKLILSNNRNNILTRAIKFGDFSVERIQQTVSPAMDIQAPSNFERYLYFLHKGDTEKVSDSMDMFNHANELEFRGSMLAQLQKDFVASDADNEVIKKVISDVYRTSEYIVDPHTACAIHASRRLELTGRYTICLSTAHPAKFSEVIEETLGFHPIELDAISGLNKLPERKVRLDADNNDIKNYIIEMLNK